METLTKNTDKRILEKLSEHIFQVHSDADLDPLIEKMGDARIVLLGEASHGTHEYYSWRAKISKRLIEEKDFDFVGVEGDWPDCYRLNRYVKGYFGDEKNVTDVLHEFTRWPTWMWANWETAAFLGWLKNRNQHLGRHERAGFYGLDVYSLWESLEAIISYLEDKDPAGLEAAKEAFSCFEPFGKEDGSAYAAANRMVDLSCEQEVVHLLKEIREKSAQYNSDPEGALNAERNAAVIANAETYYRTMVQSSSRSWNVRDQHMADTLDKLLDHYGPESKAIVWEHNTHIGDARFTDMAGAGMYNIGQLAREKYGRENCFLLGFGSYRGTVIAAKSWGAEMEEIEVPEARRGSWEHLLHQTGKDSFVVELDKVKKEGMLKDTIGHRAIGVVYRPAYEAYGNYVPSVLPDRYDAFHFIDETNALHPLHMKPEGHEIPETYPWGV